MSDLTKPGDRDPRLDRATDEVASAHKSLEQRLAEQRAKRSGRPPGGLSTRERIDQRKAERNVSDANARLIETMERLIVQGEARDETMRKSLEGLRRQIGRGNMAGIVLQAQAKAADDRARSAAELVTSDEGFKHAFLEGNGPRDGKGRLARNLLIPVGKFFGGESKATPLATDATTRFVEAVRLPPVGPALRTLRIRSLLTVTKMESPSIEYLREVAFLAATRGSMTSITSSGTVATATTAAAHGLVAGDYVSIRGAVETKYNGDDIKVLTAPTTTTFTYAVVSAGATSATGTITWVKGRTHGAAAVVAEGGTKPMAEWVPELITANAVTIAHGMVVTDQAIKDIPRLESLINNRLLYGLAFKEDYELLYGSGAANNIQGLLTAANIQTYLWSTGEAGPPADKKGDAVRRAMTLVLLAEYEATGGIFHPLDYEDIELQKSDDGMYMYYPMYLGTDMGLRLWRLPIVQTPAIAEGTFVVANLQQAAELFDREEANIRLFDQHGELAASNQVYIRAEQREQLAIYRPQAIVKGTFDSAPA